MEGLLFFIYISVLLRNLSIFRPNLRFFIRYFSAGVGEHCRFLLREMRQKLRTRIGMGVGKEKTSFVSADYG